MTATCTKPPRMTYLNAALKRQKLGKPVKGDRKYTLKRNRFLNDLTVRCQGCELLYADERSYLDHALFCEQLDEHKKQMIREGKYARVNFAETIIL